MTVKKKKKKEKKGEKKTKPTAYVEVAKGTSHFQPSSRQRFSPCLHCLSQSTLTAYLDESFELQLYWECTY